MGQTTEERSETSSEEPWSEQEDDADQGQEEESCQQDSFFRRGQRDVDVHPDLRSTVASSSDVQVVVVMNRTIHWYVERS